MVVLLHFVRANPVKEALMPEEAFEKVAIITEHREGGDVDRHQPFRFSCTDHGDHCIQIDGYGEGILHNPHRDTVEEGHWARGNQLLTVKDARLEPRDATITGGFKIFGPGNQHYYTVLLTNR